MASSTHDTSHALPHEGPIKTPKQLIVAVLFAFVVPIIAIILLVTYVTSENKPSAGSEGLGAQAVARRIERVGSVQIKDVSEPGALKTGEQVYNTQCAACHAVGAANAPKFGDAGAWGPRIKQGFDTLVQSALKGKGAMPPQGGGDFSEVEIGRAVAYMANHGGANFPEPQAAPAAAAPAAATDPGAAQAASAVAAALATAQKPAGAASPSAAAATGSVPALYAQSCQTCHATGVANAPKLGDKAAWAPRVAQGVDALTDSAIKGKGAMPPRGGSSANDAEIKSVVTYMVNSSK
jgi:cytochrome c5